MKRKIIGKILRRTGLTLLVTVLFLVSALYITLYNIAHGPSPTVRDILVLAAKQGSATKWVPSLFFKEDVIGEIMNASAVTETVQISDLLPVQPSHDPRVTMTAAQDTPVSEEPSPPPDPWENAIDGMRLETYLGATFKAYVLMVKDPSRVYTAKPKGEYGYDRSGIWVFDLLKDESIIACINGGGFYDPGGVGSGGVPLGITYSEGQCVWDDQSKLSFVGIDNNHRLIARTSMTREEADALGIRDGACFSTNNVLISSEDGALTAFYADKDAALAQRTAIGQTEDGTMLLMVTEGRTAAYPGANRNDIINAMLSYGAVTAAMLDGGSSTIMCYPGYYEKYNFDPNELNKLQKRGLVNSARAFMNPRSIPTYFAVRR